MDITLDEARRIDALKMAIKVGSKLGFTIDEIVKTAKDFEVYLKGAENAQN